jgi:hypothetical protein
MKRLIITESDRENILNQHKKAIQNENIGGRSDTRTDKMRQKYPDGIEMPKEITSSGENTFSNGVDKINETDPKVKEIIKTISDALSKSTGDVKIVVNGGASAVGSASGYDNKALAARRRDNLINLIKKNFQNDSRLKIEPGTAVVGKATERDSPSANKEQFVSAKITGTGKMNVPLKLDYQDNTSVYKPEIFRNKEKDRIPVTFDPEIRICLRIPKSKKQSFIKMLSVWARENGIAGEVPWRETKIK